MPLRAFLKTIGMGTGLERNEDSKEGVCGGTGRGERR